MAFNQYTKHPDYQPTPHGRRCTHCHEFKGFTEYIWRAEQGKWRTQCNSCRLAQRKLFRDANPDRIKKQKKLDYEKRKPEILAKHRAYEKTNRPRLNAKRREWVEKNKPKVYAKINARKRKMRTRSLGVKRQLIESTYLLAQLTGFVVDHIIPLQGEIVSGLHVPWNFQLLTQTENGQKCNKFCNSEYQKWRVSGEVGPFLPK